MSADFFSKPIPNSPYAHPSRHWELDEQGQSTQKIIETRRPTAFVTPIPKPKKRKSSEKQSSIVFDEGKGLSTQEQQYDVTAIINGADGIACWFIDTDYNEESFFVSNAYFLGANNPYCALKATLKAESGPETWATLNSDTSRAFDKPKSGRIAVKVVNHLGDEVMKVFRL